MRYNMTNLLWLVTFLNFGLPMSSVAVAGHEIGNGGETLVCRQADDDVSPITSIELFDYFEARELSGLVVDLGGADLDEWQRAALAVERIRNLSPRRYLNYKRQLDEFPQKMRLLPTARLSPLNDSNSVVIPRSCKVMQAAIRKNEPGIPFKYFIDRELWDAMDTTQRAGLVLHEILHVSFYRMIDEDHGDSTFTRRFNSLLADTRVGLSVYNLQNFTQLLFSLENNWIDVGRLVFDIVPIENQIQIRDIGEAKFNLAFYPDGKVKEGRLATRLGIMMPKDGVFSWPLIQPGNVKEVLLEACATDLFIEAIQDPRERPCGNVTFSPDGRLTSLKGRGTLVFDNHRERFNYAVKFAADGTATYE